MKAQAETLLKSLDRLETLVAFPAGHAGAWDEAEAIALSFRRAALRGQAGDLATKLSYRVGYVRGATAVNEARERQLLTDAIWRLRGQLEAIKNRP